MQSAVLQDATTMSWPLRIIRDSAQLRLWGALHKRKNWMFYGTDTHAEAAAAIFSVIASCRLHGIDPFTYLDEILRVLPYWPHDRYLELAPAQWRGTRARLVPEQLESPISHITVPPVPPPPDTTPATATALAIVT